MARYIEVNNPNSLIYIGFATHSNDITLHLLKYVPNDEDSRNSKNQQNLDSSDEIDDEMYICNNLY